VFGGQAHLGSGYSTPPDPLAIIRKRKEREGEGRFQKGDGGMESFKGDLLQGLKGDRCPCPEVEEQEDMPWNSLHSHLHYTTPLKITQNKSNIC